jgi:hypothetical protein
LAYTLFFWLVPTIITVVILVFARQPIKPADLIIHGEFLIYSITLVAGSTRLLTKDARKLGPFVRRQEFNLASYILIVPAIAAYGVIRYWATSPPVNGINTPAIVGYSVVLLASSFGFAFLVFVIDAQRTAQLMGDLQKRAAKAMSKSETQLAEQFDALEDTPAPPTPTEQAPTAPVVVAKEEEIAIVQMMEEEETLPPPVAPKDEEDDDAD